MYPKIQSVIIVEDMKLKVLFEDGTVKIYNCSKLITEEPFNRLKDPILFRNVHVDAGGYGISWDNSIDLSESELWEYGQEI